MLYPFLFLSAAGIQFVHRCLCAGLSLLFTRLLRLCCLFSLSFAALLGVFRLQANDDREQQAFIAFPQRCETPCFLGLRPGYTFIDTAVRTLDRHTWVVDLNNGVGLMSGSGELTWRWSENAPDMINTAFPGQVRITDGIVSAIIIEMRAPVGIWQRIVSAPPASASGVRWLLRPRAECLTSPALYWSAPARLELSARDLGDRTRPPSLAQRLACAA